MKPRLGRFVRSMRPSQRRALGSLMAALILTLFYPGTSAILRPNGYPVSGSSANRGDLIAAPSAHRECGGAAQGEGRSAMWEPCLPS